MSGQFTLGVVIRRRRLALGLTQEELAERISIDGEYVRQSEISRIENGRITLPRRDRLERLASVLGLPLGEMLARSGWAGAESHFPPAATSSEASMSEPGPARNTSEAQFEQVAPPVSVGELSQPTVIRSQPAARVFDPVAMTAFRQALANMRLQSDRLQRNRVTATVMQRHFQLVTDTDPAEPD